MLNFLSEKTRDFEPSETIGSFQLGSSKNNFDGIFESACDSMMQDRIDPKLDINLMIRNDAFMESYKDSLLSQLNEDCRVYKSMDGGSRYETLYDQVSAMFDNCKEDLISESTRVGQLLPIKAIDFPILIKHNLALATKDIMQTEVTKTPIVKKQIERRWIVDEETGKRWEYPQCFFKDDYKEIYLKGRGLPIKNTPVEIQNGQCFQYNIPRNLSDSDDYTRERITIDLRIVEANIDAVPATEDTPEIPAKKIPLQMRINLSDNTWLGGEVRDPETNELLDIITGSVDFINNTVSLSSASGKVKTVVFDGYLSNELNLRAPTFDRTREEYEWKIEDGFRADAPYSLEELEDAKALLDMDLYKETYNDLTDLLVQMEDNKILEFLDEQYDKYKGIELDPLGFNPFIREQVFDCDSSTQTTALPVEYIQKMLKFYIDHFLLGICDTAKLENLTFVCYGNPRYISLLDPEVNWVVKSGSSVGGVKLNYDYGIMNAGGMKIQVVSTMKYRASDPRKLRFIPYPLSDDQFTFKHYKYTTHILTSQNSGYRSPKRPGGSFTYIMGTSRYTSAVIQGIQGSMSFQNTPFIMQ